MALSPIQQVRLNVQDNEPGLYMLSDEEIEYLLEKYDGNVDRASLDAARIMLMKLAQRGDETVDIFSIKGSKSAESFRQALLLYINNQTLNPLNKDLTMYVGGISKSDMLKNDLNPDNNRVISPNEDRPPFGSFMSFNSWPRLGLPL